MKKDTKRIEQLLDRTRDNLKMVREEIIAGATLDHVHHELKAHEQTFANRLTELKEWNKKEEKRETMEKKTADLEERKKKLAEVKTKLLATPRDILLKIAAVNKAEIEIKADTTIEQIVDAILKKAPENI